MSGLGWVTRERAGFFDVDQHRQLKFGSMFRFVSSGYAGLYPHHVGSRADYFAEHGLQPVTTCLDIARAPHRIQVDAGIAVHYAVRLGYALDRNGTSRRYGGDDEVSLADEDGQRLAIWRQNWLWVHLEGGAPLREPAPGFDTDQSGQLAAAPARPPASPDATVVSQFRWALHETDINNHVSAIAYMERAEGALADATVDASGFHRVRIWFRRPCFLGDLMTASLERNAEEALVHLTRTEAAELCMTLCFT